MKVRKIKKVVLIEAPDWLIHPKTTKKIFSRFSSMVSLDPGD
jgi:hypothetical protein